MLRPKKAANAAAGNLDSPELHALEQLAEKDTGKDDSPFTVYEDIRENSFRGEFHEIRSPLFMKPIPRFARKSCSPKSVLDVSFVRIT